VAKTSLTFTQAFTRGVLANWMVCIVSVLPGCWRWCCDHLL